MSYAVQQFFQNGGRDARDRARRPPGRRRDARDQAERSPLGGGGGKNARAGRSERGRIWSAQLRVRIDHETKDKDDVTQLFNLSIKDTATGVVEVFRNLPLDTSAIGPLIEQQSRSSRVDHVADRPAGQHTDVARGGRSVRPDGGVAVLGVRSGDAAVDGDQSTRPTSSRRATTGLGMYALDSCRPVQPPLHPADPAAERDDRGSRPRIASRRAERPPSASKSAPSSSSTRIPTGRGPAQITSGGIQLSDLRHGDRILGRAGTRRSTSRT